MPTKTYLIPKANIETFVKGFDRMNEFAKIFNSEASEMRIVREIDMQTSNGTGNKTMRMVEIEAIIKEIQPDVFAMLESSAFTVVCNESVESNHTPVEDDIIHELHDSEWQGKIGEMIDLTATVKSMEVIKNQYGESYLYIMTDEHGNIFKWYATNPKLEPGKQYTLRGKVKAHETYENVKETTISRCRVKKNVI